MGDKNKYISHIKQLFVIWVINYYLRIDGTTDETLNGMYISLINHIIQFSEKKLDKYSSREEADKYIQNIKNNMIISLSSIPVIGILSLVLNTNLTKVPFTHSCFVGWNGDYEKTSDGNFLKFLEKIKTNAKYKSPKSHNEVRNKFREKIKMANNKLKMVKNLYLEFYSVLHQENNDYGISLGGPDVEKKMKLRAKGKFIFDYLSYKFTNTDTRVKQNDIPILVYFRNLNSYPFENEGITNVAEYVLNAQSDIGDFIESDWLLHII